VVAWMKQQGDQDEIFGRPLLIGQPIPAVDSEKSSRRKRRRNEDVEE